MGVLGPEITVENPDPNLFYNQVMNLTPDMHEISVNVNESDLQRFKSPQSIHQNGYYYGIYSFFTYLGPLMTEKKDSKYIHGSIRTYDKRLNIEETTKGFYDEDEP